MNEWLALTIGNSRCHWALFENETLCQSWDAPPMDEAVVNAFIAHPGGFIPLLNGKARPELWFASVVSKQSKPWTAYPQVKVITLAQIPLHHVYSTLGIDRALALWGAIATYGSPALVIDCGTAMTFTGADPQGNLVGGAILPGLKLQVQALGQNTAALPELEAKLISDVPPRWARTTESAIASGILQSAIASIQSFVLDWQQHFSNGAIVITGGDAVLLHHLLRQELPGVFSVIELDLNLAFWGIRELRRRVKVV
ncbi:pantothenate kinase [Myxacorys almedinensis]|uniref:Type III pantothenate kinase n=1 Tax=Myxacorys almedinensis A TaxID=2690445 RepID=A0A8J8CHW0_9CYAN|nr:pantothenate kinase [Myxacorys almedinensis]NDJ17118.1 pantothenate kinase [Myxacorys almedinensis A]